MRSLPAAVRTRFAAKRYMDDILLVYAEAEDWDHAKLVADFEESQCYQKPLKLEEGGNGTFLETSFQVTGSSVRFWLKNANAGGVKKLWRYQHFDSYATYEQKRATLTVCLRKVQRMASDRDALESSGRDKIREFVDLGYPRRMLKAICNFLGASTRERGWFDVRDSI